MAESVTPASYGSVESYAKILRGTRHEWLDSSALAIVQIIADDKNAGEGDRLARIRNVVSAAGRVRAERDADSTGLTYSREADDPTPVSGGRVEPHVGAVTDAGLVDETEVQCAAAAPHAPHRMTFAPEMGIPDRICPGRCTQVCIDMAVDGAPQNAHKGWHDDECPAVVDIADVR